MPSLTRLLITLICTTSFTTAVFFRPPPRPNVPDPPAPNPVIPKPNNPNEPDPPNPGYYNPNQPRPRPSEEVVQQNMQQVERKFDALDAAEFVGHLSDFVSGILASPTEAEAETGTRLFIGFTGTPTTSTTPTTAPIPISSFEACTSYAHILSSCASATPGFYTRNATAQASCACYTTTPLNDNACTKDEIITVTPTLNVTRIDSMASKCSEFFFRQGYTNVASALAGRNATAGSNSSFSDVVMGKGFCGNVDEGLRARRNLTKGLGETGEAFPSRQCAGFFNPGGGGGGNEVQGGVGGLALTRFDLAVLVGYSLAVVAMSWVVFT